MIDAASNDEKDKNSVDKIKFIKVNPSSSESPNKKKTIQFKQKINQNILQLRDEILLARNDPMSKLFSPSNMEPAKLKLSRNQAFATPKSNKFHTI